MILLKTISCEKSNEMDLDHVGGEHGPDLSDSYDDSMVDEDSDISDSNCNDEDELMATYTDTSDCEEEFESLNQCHGVVEADRFDTATKNQPGPFTLARELLCSQATMSQHEFLISFLSIFNQHCLTYSCAADFLKLFSQVLPVPNSVPQTPQTLLKKFVNYEASTIMHQCCGYCTMPLIDGKSCPQTECKSMSAANSAFVEVRLDKQIQKLFSGTDQATYLVTYVVCM